MRKTNTTRSGYSFGQDVIEAVWRKAAPYPGYSTLRTDACGATMSKTRYGETTEFGWEIDHILPVSLGGSDEINNLQALQWENNRFKEDDYPNYKCKIRS